MVPEKHGTLTAETAGSILKETVELVRSFDPVLVIAGSENGVPLATHLSDELGLPGNPWKNIDKMINEEALEFCRENGFTTAADVVATRL